MNLLLDTPVALWAITDHPKLSIEAEHVVAVEQLARHHDDPFDRILVAQALTEPMRLITHDSLVASCSDTIIQI